MNEFTLSDLCILIPLLEKELDQIHLNIESESENISNDAAELSIPYGQTSAKLEKAYRALWQEGCNYPSYEQLTTSQ